MSQGNITAVAFTDESQVVVGFVNGDICRWKIEDGRQRGHSGLGNVEFTITDNLLKGKRRKIVFAHPWIHRILGRSSVVAQAGDPDFDIDSNRMATLVQMTFCHHTLFSALLLVQQPDGGFKRVSTENEIVASGPGTNVTSKTIRPKVLEIL